ncbi:MAG: GMP synthase [Pseudomonadales bacterium]|nr:GMP synthase [Pseudomonadales bacterium]
MVTQIGILKTGSTHPRLRAIFGDFDTWFRVHRGPAGTSPAGIGQADFTLFDIAGGATPPPLEQCRGYIITGSPAMVTAREPWSEALKPWLQQVVAARVPLLAVCYGHQLLAEALGGAAGWHPRGTEIGTVEITLTEAGREDPLLGALPPRFLAQVTHSQSALRLPPEAVLLAANEFEPHHGFRLGPMAWGVQFHPEFSADIMRGYLFEASDKLLAAGQDVRALLARVRPADADQRLLERFVALCDAAG